MAKTLVLSCAWPGEHASAEALSAAVQACGAGLGLSWHARQCWAGPACLLPARLACMLTGLPASVHGALSFVEARPDGAQWREASRPRLRAAPVWERLADAGHRVAVLHWPWTRGSDHPDLAVVTTDFFEPGRLNPGRWTRLPGMTYPDTLCPRWDELCIHPGELAPQVVRDFGWDEAGPEALGRHAEALAELFSVHAVATECLAADYSHGFVAWPRSTAAMPLSGFRAWFQACIARLRRLEPDLALVLLIDGALGDGRVGSVCLASEQPAGTPQADDLGQLLGLAAPVGVPLSAAEWARLGLAWWPPRLLPEAQQLASAIRGDVLEAARLSGVALTVSAESGGT